MNKDILERIEGYLQQIAEDLHAMRKAQAAELKLIMAMLPPQQEEEDPAAEYANDIEDEPVKNALKESVRRAYRKRLEEDKNARD